MNEILSSFTKNVCEHLALVLENSELITIGVVHNSELNKHFCLCEIRFVDNSLANNEISINYSIDVFTEITNKFFLEDNNFNGICFLLGEKLFHCFNEDRVYILRLKDESLWDKEQSEYIARNLVSDMMMMNSK